MKTLSGGQLAGGNSEYGRVDNDFYATDPKAVMALCHTHILFGREVLEPCVGQGHIAKTLLKYDPNINITAIDLVDRGYPNTVVTDFLTWKPPYEYSAIVTNPPYSLAKEFVEKGMECLCEGGYMCMFLKIQFLEGAKRKELFDKYPPKYIYVFRNRMPTWNNGQPKDPTTGKKWATTMCHAWFIWEKGSTSEPVVRWL